MARNSWWFTRPKRSLESVPRILKEIAANYLDHPWKGKRSQHLALENSLEETQIKAFGDRRDAGGSGARTYMAWLFSLGLVFYDAEDGKLRLTLAGEALINDEDPVNVLTHQIMKYQFPSAFTRSGKSQVAPDFKIRPIIFLLQLLTDSRLDNRLSEEELARIVLVKAKKHRDLDRVANEIVAFRLEKPSLDEEAFQAQWGSSYKNLKDVANTIFNWLDYTRLTNRIINSPGEMQISTGRLNDVNQLLEVYLEKPLLKLTDNDVQYQRSFGLSPGKIKDTRKFSDNGSLSKERQRELIVESIFQKMGDTSPIILPTSADFMRIAQSSGLPVDDVVKIITNKYPRGNLNSFLANYRAMAFNSRSQALEFEKTTANVFNNIFGYQTRTIGQTGRKLDILMFSDSEGYQAIIDTKAYTNYSITSNNEHAMTVEYIPKISTYSEWPNNPLAFYLYIAGGFKTTINNGLHTVTQKTGIPGSAIGIDPLIQLIQLKQSAGDSDWNHQKLRQLFAKNKEILPTDF